jgi:hypothetical protein
MTGSNLCTVSYVKSFVSRVGWREMYSTKFQVMYSDGYYLGPQLPASLSAAELDRTGIMIHSDEAMVDKIS